MKMKSEKKKKTRTEERIESENINERIMVKKADYSQKL